MPGDEITPIPVHVATWESAEEARTNETYPLQCISHHYKGRTHSTYGNLSNNLEAHPQKIWINTRDAAARGIANDDVVKVFNDRGTIQCQALVTPRIVPGAISVPQGAGQTRPALTAPPHRRSSSRSRGHRSDRAPAGAGYASTPPAGSQIAAGQARPADRRAGAASSSTAPGRPTATLARTSLVLPSPARTRGMQVCPTTAMTQREDGTIYVDDSKCVGCRYCEWACPYSAPQFNAATGHMSKCDLCYDYRFETGRSRSSRPRRCGRP